MVLCGLFSSQPNMSTREPGLTQAAVLNSFKTASKYQTQMQALSEKGLTQIATLEDTSNLRYVSILTLDTTAILKFKKAKSDFLHLSEEGILAAREYQQSVHDRHSRLRANLWQESVAERGQEEQNEKSFIQKIKPLEKAVEESFKLLINYQQELDTMPVPKPKPAPAIYIPVSS